MTKKLEAKMKEWKNIGKKDNEITWGMLCDGFQSLGGIPDDFYSAEDPDVRVKLWNERNAYKPRNSCGSSNCGWCSICDPTYKD